MDIIDYFNKIQDSMIKTFNKSLSRINKSISQDYKRPSCEISHSKEGITIKINLPGMNKKDVILNITHNYLEILAEKKRIKEKRSRKSYRKEENLVGYRRIIPLPPGLITDDTDAKFNKGKLTIKIPKVKIGKIKVK